MSNRARTGIALSLTFALALSFQPAAMAASPEPVKGEHGMVVTAQKLASDVGVAVLKEGGNAVDAAVAVGYALAVVYPAAGNLGGGGFMTIRLKDGRTTFLDFRERAPLASTKTMYLDDKGEIIKVALVTTREGKATGSVNSGQADLGGNASQSGSAADFLGWK